MVVHTSPRCNNGMRIHIHSERFALYYTLFSNDVLRLNGDISRFDMLTLLLFIHLLPVLRKFLNSRICQ